MATMNISLPDSMKAFIEEQAGKAGFGTVSEYMRAIIREVQERELHRQEVRGKLLEAVQSGPAVPMTGEDWEGIRREVHKRHAERQGGANGRKGTERR
jgi:antitoxin ParD1/3/4